jgi:AcrR family transcriptional regulator
MTAPRNPRLPGSLWQRQPPMSRDRTTVVTRREIAAAAFAVAEAENLQAVTVKRIAGRLGLPAPRLEGYFADRTELLDLMVDEALGEAEVASVAAGQDWRVQLWQIAHALRALVQRRPWLAGLLGLRAPSGPNGLRFTERCLEAVVGLGEDIATAALCVEAVIVYVSGSVRPEAARGVPSGRTAPGAIAEYLAEEVSPETYPMLAQLLARPSGLTADEVFDTGLTYLLNGMATDRRELRAFLRG